MEIHPDDWWVRKFELYGFRYDDALTQEARAWARLDFGRNGSVLPDGQWTRPQHLTMSLKVFVNPAVGALPEHQHLFPDDGCFRGKNPEPGGFFALRRPCGTAAAASGGGGVQADLETPLPDHMGPLPVTPDMHARWNATIAQRLRAEAGGVP